MKISLVWQIFIALILGVISAAVIKYGLKLDESVVQDLIANYLKPAGDIFIHLIKMIVVPIVVSTLIVGIAGMGDAKKLGKVGFKTIIYFEIVTTIAIFVGIFCANFFKAGHGVDMTQLQLGDISKYQQTVDQVQSQGHGVLLQILHIVPTNFIESLTSANMLQIIFFSVLFGLGLASLPDSKGTPLINFFRVVSETMFWVTNVVMKYAPIGVYAFITMTILTFGFEALIPLGKLVLVVYGAVIFFGVVVLGVVAKIFNLNIFKILLMIKDEIILAFSTASSEVALPKLIEKTKRYGVSDEVAGFVIPTGYTFNLDGSTLYQSIAAIFIAQLWGIDLTIWQELTLVLTLMITSKGIAGVPGASIVVLLATITVVVPGDKGFQGVAFIMGVERLLDMARTVLNVVGNALAALVIAKWEGNYDQAKADAYEKNGFKTVDSVVSHK